MLIFTVFGPPAMADNGTLIFVLAGKSSSIEKVEPYTKFMGRAVIPIDGPASKASLMKITGNTIILNMVEAIAQSLSMAEATGLGTEPVKSFLSHFFGGTPYPAYADRMLQGDYYKKEPLMTVDNVIKDASHAIKIAENSGARLPSVEVGLKHLQSVKEVQGVKGDMASIYGASRKESGLPYYTDGRKE
jgi:3-hydroxyisobutyrate dehydrogenase-like beta-hydroxyacid dehydrogenase